MHTSSSTYVAPAFVMSSRILLTAVTVRPCRTLAEMSSCGPWQIDATGLPLSTKLRVKATAESSMRRFSGDPRPG